MSGGGRDDVPEAEESISRGRGTRRRGYRYEVLCGRAGADPDALVALAATPMTAFAAYYAAVREHFGETVVLKRDGCVIQRSRPARPEA